MRKGIITSLLLISIILSSCANSSLFMSDSQRIDTQFNQVLTALENGDREGLKMLFSPRSVEQSQNFNKNMDLLFGYYAGGNATYEDDGPLVAEKSQDYGIERKVIEKSYDVTTDVDTYRFAIRFVVVDDTDADSVGIWSLYVIKRLDDTKPNMTYWGDGKNTPGINIGIIGPN